MKKAGRVSFRPFQLQMWHGVNRCVYHPVLPDAGAGLTWLGLSAYSATFLARGARVVFAAVLLALSGLRGLRVARFAAASLAPATAVLVAATFTRPPLGITAPPALLVLRVRVVLAGAAVPSAALRARGFLAGLSSSSSSVVWIAIIS